MSFYKQSKADVVYANSVFYTKGYQGVEFLHQYYLIRLQVEGQSEGKIDQTDRIFYPGDLLLLPPGAISQFSFAPDSKTLKVNSGHYLVKCQGDWITQWWNSVPRPETSSIVLNESLINIFKELVLEQRKIRDHWTEASDYLLRVLCLHLDRALQHHGSDRTLRKQFIGQRMKHYIEAHLVSPGLRIAHIANYVGLSESRASHLFKEIFGESIISFCLNNRLDIACDRIKFTELTLEHIADITGFGSYPYFNRAFRKKYGISPSEYRNQMSKN